MPTWIGGDAGMRDVADWQPTYVAPQVDADGALGRVGGREPFDHHAAQRAPRVRRRVDASRPDASFEARSPARPVPLARTMLDQLSLPMLGEAAALHEPGMVALDGDRVAQTSYSSPGMMADRAHAWSVAQERSTSDLAFDFVTPELVLAARVYGLGPAEAAQAARLAIAGPGQLSAMAERGRSHVRPGDGDRGPAAR